MEKKMFALTYCYEGTDNTNPYGTTIAVSTDIEKLKAEMEKCVDEDCEIDGVHFFNFYSQKILKCQFFFLPLYQLKIIKL